MCCSRKNNHLKALLKKNWIITKRNKCTTFCEIFLPAIFILQFFILRQQVDIKDLPQQSFLNQTQIINPDLSDPSSQNRFYHCSQLEKSGGQVAIFPENSLTQQIAVELKKNQYISSQGIIFMKSANDLEDLVQSSSYPNSQNKICFAIEFNNFSNGLYDYSIRYNSTKIPDQYEYNQENQYVKQQLDYYNTYIDYGFIDLMNLISNIIYTNEASKPEQIMKIVPHLLPMMQEKQEEDNFYNMAGQSTNFYIVLPLIVFYLRMTNGVLMEKEKKIREGMKMMGMDNFQFYQSWIVTYTIKNIFISILIAGLLNGCIFKDGSFLFLFSFYNLFCQVLIFQGLFISTFFSRARVGLLAAMVFFLGQFIAFMSIDIKSASKDTLTMLSLIPHAGVSLSVSHFLYFQSNGQSIDFSILNQSFNGYKQYFTFVSLQINLVVFSLLFFYLDKVFPNEFGVKSHPLFFLGMKYGKKVEKKSKKNHKTKNVELIQDLYNNSSGDDEESDENAIQEDVDGALRAQIKNDQAIVIKNLKKVFHSDGKEKKAVNGLNLEMFNSQIFSFLGHNGAGKTTTISMINGLTEPTSGSIKIKGYDVQTQMEEIRKTLGVCPQHDVLFDDLTVKEHLELFANIKNMPVQEQEAAIQKIIEDVDLVEKTNYLSKNLSGGQKRKLSVAIAFIGGSDVILLDEPTSGMDVEARRHIWDVLKNYKQDKIIILTTHFMDEADFLGDRIGIISDGKLKCVGSSIFLKENYGNGFNITFVKQENTSPSKPLIKYVKQNLSDCELISDVSAEVAFQVPKSNIEKFQEFFTKLEKNKDSLYVRSYGISVTTLEQVFLKVASENNNFSTQINKKQSKQKEVDDFDLSKVRIKGSFSIFSQHFSALLKKRFHCFRRDIGGLFCEVIIPVALIILGLLVSTAISVNLTPTIILTPDSLSSPTYMYGSEVSSQQDYFNKLPLLTKTAMQPILSTTNLIQQFDTQMLLKRNIELKFGVYTRTDFIDSNNKKINYYSFINTQTENSIAISLNILNTQIINQQTGKSIQIIPRNKPLPYTQKQKDANQIANGITIAMIFNIGLAFIPASLIVFIVKERETQVKHQQIVSGVTRFSYWTSNLFMDIIKYLIPALTCPWLAYAFKVNSLTDSSVFSAFYLIFILYGPAIILFTYVFSFLVKNYGNGQLFSFFMHIFFGCVLSITIMILRLIYSMDNKGIEALAWILRFMPSFCFSFSILNLTSRALYALSTTDGKMLDPFDLKIAGGDLLAMCLQIVIFGLLLVIIEKLGKRKLFSKESNIPYQPKKLDYDVEEENQRVAQSDPNDFVVYVQGLRKVFYESGSQYKVAVDNLNFAIQNGEVFCLLGVNGAGKTTTMRMLTGDEPIVNGNAYIQGYKIPEELVHAQQYIGYCPQFDALLDKLTAREHLELYAAIKGIPKDMIAPLVDKKLDEMNLRQFENICAGTYSGGNKRKLSVAIAMLGNPPIVFLDEPSTGMDPGNRRFMWDVISRISTQRKQSSIILTTHSMEEAEALSTKVGIMVAGNFQCMGSVQHLKSKFGEGYEIDIKTTLPTNKQINKFSKTVNMKQQIKRKDIKDFLFQLNMQNMLYQITEKGFCSQLHYEFLKKEEKGQGIEPRLIIEFGLMFQKTLKVQEFINQRFGEFTIIEQFNNFTRYRIFSEKSIGEIFGIFNSVQAELDINHYTVNQPTLEQIFNQIAKKANQQLQNYQEVNSSKDPQNKIKDRKKRNVKNQASDEEEIEMQKLVMSKKEKSKKKVKASQQEETSEDVNENKKISQKKGSSKGKKIQKEESDQEDYQMESEQSFTDYYNDRKKFFITEDISNKKNKKVEKNIKQNKYENNQNIQIKQVVSENQSIDQFQESNTNNKIQEDRSNNTLQTYHQSQEVQQQDNIYDYYNNSNQIDQHEEYNDFTQPYQNQVNQQGYNSQQQYYNHDNQNQSDYENFNQSNYNQNQNQNKENYQDNFYQQPTHEEEKEKSSKQGKSQKSSKSNKKTKKN
ncbi:hypothetical protein ABPG74_002289 [Tetrahymena malaccensis]